MLAVVRTRPRFLINNNGSSVFSDIIFRWCFLVSTQPKSQIIESRKQPSFCIPFGSFKGYLYQYQYQVQYLVNVYHVPGMSCTRYRVPWILYLVPRILDLELLLPGIWDDNYGTLDILFASSFIRPGTNDPKKMWNTIWKSRRAFCCLKKCIVGTNDARKIWTIIWTEKRKEERGTHHEQQFEKHPGVAGVSFRRVWLTLRSFWPCYPTISKTGFGAFKKTKKIQRYRDL